MIEFTASFMALVLIFLGIVTVSLMYNDYISIQRVAREGAREAVITGSLSSGQQKAYQAAWLWGLKPENLTVSLSQRDEGNRTLITCNVRYKTNLFHYTFPTLAGGSPLKDFYMNTRAVFGWKDFS